MLRSISGVVVQKRDSDLFGEQHYPHLLHAYSGWGYCAGLIAGAGGPLGAWPSDIPDGPTTGMSGMGAATKGGEYRLPSGVSIVAERRLGRLLRDTFEDLGSLIRVLHAEDQNRSIRAGFHAAVNVVDVDVIFAELGCGARQLAWTMREFD